MTGFGPTAVGYFVQGGGKFAGYEFWKKQFVTLAGDKDAAVRYRTAIYLGAASVGESVFFFYPYLFFLQISVTPISVIWAHARASTTVDSLRTCS
jgi:solute carrier family 25 phosphate transporter 3